MKHLYKQLQLLLVILFISSPCFAKNTSLAADFTVRSSGNSHFSFIANVVSSTQFVSYYWNFGDGSTMGWASDGIANHTFTASRMYQVMLVARNVSGDIDTVIHSIVSNVYAGSAIANFNYSPSVIFAGAPVQFINITTRPSGSTAVRWWDFSDGTFVQDPGENQQHIFAQPGVYSVYLTAGNDTTIQTIRVLPAGLAASFTVPPSPLCKYHPVQFVDQSASTNSTIMSWQWSFGDGSISNLQNPSYSYGFPGMYNVMLIVTDNTGARDTTVTTISVVYATITDFTYPAAIYAGDTVQFTDISLPVCSTPTHWEWTGFGPSNFFWHSLGQVPPPVVFPLPGDYIIMLYTGDSVIKTIRVYPAGNKAICPGGTAVMSAPAGGSSYQWQESIDNGNSWQSLQDDGIAFSGVQTSTLTISNAPSLWYGNQYRCQVDAVPVVKYTLQFANTFTSTDPAIGAWEDAASWSCQSLPDIYTDVIISGAVTINSNAVCRSIKVLPGSSVFVMPGAHLTVVH